MTFNFPFNAVELTQAVNLRPNTYGALQRMNLFPSKSIATTSVRIDVYEGKIRVLPNSDRSAPPIPREKRGRKAILMEVATVSNDILITPDDIQNLQTAAASELQMMTPEQMVVEELDDLRAEHDLTLEYFRYGALKGNILDGDGVVIENLFDALGVSQITVDFDLDNASADISAKCAAVIQAISDGLRGETMTGVVAKVSPNFYNKLTKHPNVIKFYEGYVAAQQLANPTRIEQGGHMMREFTHGNISFQEEWGKGELQSGIDDPFIAAGEGYATPVGTRSAFETFFAPPPIMDLANKPGAEIYVSPHTLPHGAGIELRGYMCPLPVAKQPNTIIKLTE